MEKSLHYQYWLAIHILVYKVTPKMVSLGAPNYNRFMEAHEKDSISFNCNEQYEAF